MKLGFASFLLIFCFLASLSSAVHIPELYKNYIQSILTSFVQGTITTDFGAIYPQRPQVTSIPEPQNYTLPVLYIWDPLLQYEDVFSINPLFCEEHKQKLEAGRWTDGSSNSLNPRVMLGSDTPGLLIARDYYCRSGETRHYIRSTDGRFIENIKSLLDVPFKLTHKYGFTNIFITTLRNFVSNGISFNLYQTIHMGNQLAEAMRRKGNFEKHCQLKRIGPLSTESVEAAFNTYETFLINACPSDDVLGDVFLKDFGERKSLYEEAMLRTSARALMADHTFKVSINIGITREPDNYWLKLYNSLFIVLNEKHEVVAWKLTKKEQFNIVKELLEHLQERIKTRGGKVEIFMIDNCCKWRSKIQELFGKDVVVLLDLFHAIQRVTRTVHKQNSFYGAVARDIALVFRADNDKGRGMRTKPTPNTETLLNNLENFEAKWRHISNTATDGEQLLRDSFEEQLSNLKEHVAKGCLSFIPQGYSTSTNECLHEKINDLFAGAKMGPELAFALLTVFFYGWNSRRNSKIKGIPFVQPLETIQKEEPTKRKEKFGIGNSSPLSNRDTVQCFLQDGKSASQNTESISRATYLFDLFETLQTKSSRKLPINIYKFFFESEYIKFLLRLENNNLTEKSSISNNNNTQSEFIDRNLCSVLSMFNFSLHNISRNGDCLFNAISFYILGLLKDKTCSIKIMDHFLYMGLNDSQTEEEMGLQLRHLMVMELISNKEKYLGFLNSSQQQNQLFEETVKNFAKPGVFSGDLGDLMVKAIANTLKVSIVILSNIKNYPVITISPDIFAAHCVGNCLFVAFRREGPGHYDAVIKLNNSEESKQSKDKTSAQPKEYCSCGVNNKEWKEVCCNTITNSKRHYQCRCPCLQNQKPCKINCKCKGCNNPHGVHVIYTNKQNKRKRAENQFGGDRKRGLDFLTANDETVAGGKWTEEENCILMQHIMSKPDVLNKDSTAKTIEDLTQMYNASVEQAPSFGLQHVRVKDKKQVGSKLLQLRNISNSMLTKGLISQHDHTHQ